MRERLSPADRAILTANFSVGPQYPGPSTVRQFIDAAERAVRLAPDRLEAWKLLGDWYLNYGAQTSPDWNRRSAGAFDSIIALDSSYAPALEPRLWSALVDGNVEEIRRYAHLFSTADSERGGSAATYWWVATALNDTSALDSLRARFHEFDRDEIGEMIAISTYRGIPLGDAVLAAQRRRQSPAAGTLVGSRWVAAVVRGQVQHAAMLRDSTRDPGQFAWWVITLGLLQEPGYQEAVEETVEWAHEASTLLAERGLEAFLLCYTTLWQTANGDTTNTRSAIEQLPDLARGRPPGLFPGVGRLNLCPMLLEAMLEQLPDQPAETEALERLESVMAQGTGLELPGNAANLLLARMWRRLGDYDRALAAVRRRQAMVRHTGFMPMVPAYLREEGRLAAMGRDTLGAIEAYNHFLTIRDDPDPGPMAAQRDSVRSELAALLERRR